MNSSSLCFYFFFTQLPHTLFNDCFSVLYSYESIISHVWYKSNKFQQSSYCLKITRMMSPKIARPTNNVVKKVIFSPSRSVEWVIYSTALLIFHFLNPFFQFIIQYDMEQQNNWQEDDKTSPAIDRRNIEGIKPSTQTPSIKWSKNSVRIKAIKTNRTREMQNIMA